MSVDWISIIFNLWTEPIRLVYPFIYTYTYIDKKNKCLKTLPSIVINRNEWRYFMENETRQRIIIVTKEPSKDTRLCCLVSLRLIFWAAMAHCIKRVRFVLRTADYIVWPLLLWKSFIFPSFYHHPFFTSTARIVYNSLFSHENCIIAT